MNFKASFSKTYSFLKKAIIELENKLEKNDFVLANLDAHGFYRINYDDKNWNLISKQLLKDVKVFIS